MVATKRVLVIDDNADIHDDFRRILAMTQNNRMSEIDAFFAEGSADKLETTEQPINQSHMPKIDLDFASQGEEGFNMVCRAREQGKPYSLAFIDMRMPPGWDGLATLGRIFEVDTDIQAVVCTAYSDYSWFEFADTIGRTDRVLVLKNLLSLSR